MPKQISYGGQIHSFPDSFTDADIAKALKSWEVSQGSVTPPVASAPSRFASAAAGEVFAPLVALSHPAETAGAIAGEFKEHPVTSVASMIPYVGHGAAFLDILKRSKEKLSQGQMAEAGGTLLGGTLSLALPWGISRNKVGSRAIPAKLQEMAANQYGRVLNPTKVQMKQEAQRVIPTALEKGIVGTRGRLERVAEQGIERSAVELERAYDALPQNTKIAGQPLYDALQKKIDDLKITTPSAGKIVAAAGGEASESALLGLQDKLINMMDQAGDIALEDARTWRGILDKYVKQRGKMWEVSTQANVEANRSLANAIRKEIAKDHPDIDKMNKTFFFYKGMEEILDATRERMTGQQLAYRTIRALAGAGLGTGVGAAQGSGALIYGAAGAALAEIMTSPAWRTTSAVTKSKVANLLMKGKLQDALFLASGPVKYMTSAYERQKQAEAMKQAEAVRK